MRALSLSLSLFTFSDLGVRPTGQYPDQAQSVMFLLMDAGQGAAVAFQLGSCFDPLGKAPAGHEKILLEVHWVGVNGLWGLVINLSVDGPARYYCAGSVQIK